MTTATEKEAWAWAVSQQGYDGTYEEWLSLAAAEREEYETGAQGIGTA